MQLTAHFSLEEFTLSSAALAHGIANDPTPVHLVSLRKLATQMEMVRALFGSVIEITSGYRNPKVNALVGGVPDSAHAVGLAADFHVHGISDLSAATRIRDSTLEFDQLIFEKGRCVHISFDTRTQGRLRRQVLRQPGGPGSQVYLGLTP